MPKRKNGAGDSRVIGWPEDVLPSSKDEKDLQEPLYGRNEASEVVLDGWANNVVKKFIGEKRDLAIKEVAYQDLVGKFECFSWDKTSFVRTANKEPCMTLADLNQRCQRFHFKISEPLVVQVLEKKCIYVTQKEGTVLLIGVVLVGDETGYCSLTMFSDVIAAVYSKIQVGNHLVIKAGSVQKPRYEVDNRVYLRQEQELKMEIKVGTYESRHVFAIAAPKKPKISEKVLPEKVIWIPSDLWNEATSDFEFPANKKAINICGVVSYVGSMFRKKFPPGKSEADKSKNRTLFYCYRWLQIVDSKVPKPISVFIQISNLSHDVLQDLAPGAAVVITNVSCDTNFKCYKFHLRSSYFTKIVLNRDIATDYLPNLPKETRDVVRKIVSPTNAQLTFQRDDIVWSAGGSLLLPIANPVPLINLFNDPSSNDETTVLFEPSKKLQRRESEIVYVHGYINKIFSVDHNTQTTKLYWSSDKMPDARIYATRRKETFLPVVDPEKFWFPFIRKLPNPTCGFLAPNKKGVFDVFEATSAANKDMVSPLLLPSKYPEGDCPNLKDYPIANGPRYFLLYLFDPHKKVRYTCLWKSLPYPDMEARLKRYVSSLKNISSSSPPKSKSTTPPQGDDDTQNAVSTDKLKADAYFVLDLLQLDDDCSTLLIDLIDFTQADA